MSIAEYRQVTSDVKLFIRSAMPCIPLQGGLTLSTLDPVQEKLVATVWAARPGGIEKRALMRQLYGNPRFSRWPSMSMLAVHCRILNAQLERGGAAVRLAYWRRPDVAFVMVA